MPKSSARLNVVNLLNTSHVPQGPCDSPVELYRHFFSRLHPPAPGSSSGNCLDQTSSCGPREEGALPGLPHISVLALAGKGLISFPVAGAVLWSCAGAELITQGCFPPCTEPGPFLLLTGPTSRGWGCRRGWGDTAEPSWDMPAPRAPCPARGAREGGDIQRWSPVLSHAMCTVNSCFCLTYQTVFSSTHAFSLFYPSCFSPQPTGRQ